MDSTINSPSAKQRVISSIDNGINLKLCDISSIKPDAIIEWFEGFRGCGGGGSRRRELVDAVEKRYRWYLGSWYDRHD
jgi:hypothetical protein